MFVSLRGENKRLFEDEDGNTSFHTLFVVILLKTTPNFSITKATLRISHIGVGWGGVGGTPAIG